MHIYIYICIHLHIYIYIYMYSYLIINNATSAITSTIITNVIMIITRSGRVGSGQARIGQVR